MAITDSVQEMIAERKKQRKNAYKKLMELMRSKIELERPVFFVPGWTDESCFNWKYGYRNQAPMKVWASKITKNPAMLNFTTFTLEESKSCVSFIDFGKILKDNIESKIGKQQEFDLIGHSMGGLDIRAAIAIHGLKNAYNCITVATPHKGTDLAGIAAKINNYPAHHKIQCQNLDPDYEPIQKINSLENRKAFLGGICKLYQFVGSRDMAVMKSAKIDKKGLSTALCDKIVTVEIGGATHSAEGGITRDVRVVLAIINIFMGVELEQPKRNYGYVYRKA